MKCNNVCNLVHAEALSDQDGIIITQQGRARRMTMPAFRDYVGLASGAPASVEYHTIQLDPANWYGAGDYYMYTAQLEAVNTSSMVVVSPNPQYATNLQYYQDNGVYCSAQGDGTLVFRARTKPSNHISVHVAVMATGGESAAALLDAEEGAF